MRKVFALPFRCALFAGGVLAAGVLAPRTASAQEVLLSDTENYYEFLALQELAERPYLNYRTLSDSTWKITEGADHPWKDSLNNPVRELSDSVRFRIYGPELFTSYNSAAPYGQNDGVLWQGKGFNSSVTAGARLEAYGFELTLKPTVAFSQNLAFDLVKPAYSGTAYEGKAEEYGYYGVKYIDAPQRFGDDPFFDYSWGDSEIRYTWKSLTAGFGTQLVWLGPAKINPIIHSNNAPPYPKFDIGLRKTAVVLPKLGWYLGHFETRLWWGYLSESDWFDNDSRNDHNMLTAFTISYAPSFFPGSVFGFHRTMLSKWNFWDYDFIVELFWPFMQETAGVDQRDQRASVSAQYTLPNSSFDLYFEWGRNDYSPSTDMVIRYPFHTQGYTLGATKKFTSKLFKLDGLVFIETTNLESSRDYEFLGATTFYAHHIITQGYTNQGQWLGSGMGTGGNSQTAGFQLVFPKGSLEIKVSRNNTDNDYVWYYGALSSSQQNRLDEYRFRTAIYSQIESNLIITKKLCVSAAFAFIRYHNFLYESSIESNIRNSLYIGTAIHYSF